MLVDDDGRAIGTMPKPLVHHGETPLHRAFSAYLFDDAGRLLVTRRAEGKRRSRACGPTRSAVTPGRGRTTPPRSRGAPGFELGVEVADLRPALPGLPLPRGVPRASSRTRSARSTSAGSPASRHPDATEVGEWELLDWAAFRERQEAEGDDAWSPWCREQALLIEAAGLVPAA